MGLIIEGFVIENLIKAGGFAGVYKVKRVIDKKTFAIKILHPKAAADRGIKSQFYREVKLLTGLRHPNIVEVYEFLTVAPRPALLMEYFDSNTLYSLIVNKSPLIQEKGLAIFRKVALALEYLHDWNILHKDIKPENILISKDGDVRLIDFSIAEKLSKVALPRFFSFLRRRKREGTPLYMSPEQIRREQLDCRTDIYSLGATFYRAFLGTSHIKADSEKSVLQQQLQGQVTKMRHINRQIPYQVDNIIMRMLKKRREDRYQSIKEMLFDLKRFPSQDSLTKPGVPVEAPVEEEPSE